MMRITPAPLPTETEKSLLALQQSIDALSTYAERVAEANRAFATQNRSDNKTFQFVRKTLGDACQGAHRCMYCEDSAADQIDHFRPKAFYPNLAFVWLNYLYSCGRCNLAKQHRFSVCDMSTSVVVPINRRRGEPPIEPPDGHSVLIDPRVDDPLDYLSLDLHGTFQFLPKHSKGTYEHQRAEYTIEVLKLNAYDWQLSARREAYGNYRARLTEYVNAKGSPKEQVLVQAMMRCAQPTVWAEMKRNAGVIAELKILFDAAPEAQTWR